MKNLKILAVFMALVFSAFADEHSFNSANLDNVFAKFYKSNFSNEALNECYKNMPEMFLKDGEAPLIVGFIDLLKYDKKLSLPENFNEKNFSIVLGESYFSSATLPKAKEATDTAKALKAKFIMYGTKTDKAKKEILAIYLLAMPRDKISDNKLLKSKCPLLFSEIK